MKKVILIGDSIRMGYQDTVRKELDGIAEVISPEGNGGNSRNVLANLDEWAISHAPDLVHINCGLHDLKLPFGSTERAVPIEEYRRNVQEILKRLRSETEADLIWVTTTPVNQKWHHDNKSFDRLEADVVAYNEAATAIADELAVSVNDLCAVVLQAGRDRILREDGVHYTPEGCEVLGKAVAEFIKPFLA